MIFPRPPASGEARPLHKVMATYHLLYHSWTPRVKTPPVIKKALGSPLENSKICLFTGGEQKPTEAEKQEMGMHIAFMIFSLRWNAWVVLWNISVYSFSWDIILSLPGLLLWDSNQVPLGLLSLWGSSSLCQLRGTTIPKSVILIKVLGSRDTGGRGWGGTWAQALFSTKERLIPVCSSPCPLIFFLSQLG